MPGRGTKDSIRGTLHLFAQSLGFSPRVDDGNPPAPPKTEASPSTTAPVKTDLSGAKEALENRQSTIDKAVDDAGA